MATEHKGNCKRRKRKWKFKLQTELETGNGRHIFTLQPLGNNTTCIEYPQVASSSGPSTQLTSY